jgi:hypothetical protein
MQGVLTQDTLLSNQTMINLMTNPWKTLPLKLGLFLLSWLLFGCSKQNEPFPESTKEVTSMKFEQSQVLVIAHRGARSLAPENTLLPH